MDPPANNSGKVQEFDWEQPVVIMVAFDAKGDNSKALAAINELNVDHVRNILRVFRVMICLLKFMDELTGNSQAQSIGELKGKQKAHIARWADAQMLDEFPRAVRMQKKNQQNFYKKIIILRIGMDQDCKKS